MARNANNILLHKAKGAKSDEFYTLYGDIERELLHYKHLFRNRTVYCNCDDFRVSNFFRYFQTNFNELGLKKLIATSYCRQYGDLFNIDETSGRATCAVYTEKEGLTVRCLQGDGDFRSPECVELLREADIVVTNPPFSLFREFIAQLVRFEKKFLVIGNINAITYKDIFAMIQANKVWMGVNMGRGISGFIVPGHYELYGSETHIDESGNRIISPNNCLWLTNLESPNRVQFIELKKSYRGNENAYPRYDNYDGINVNKTQDIPCDYDGVMGVPITFLHKYNPAQFEIIRFRKGMDDRDLSIGGKCPYFRILIRRRRHA